MVELSLPPRRRAALHHALGDERRLAIVDALHQSDRSVGELSRSTGLPTNLLAFHLDVLEDAGAIARTVSQGDARRRYVTLATDTLRLLGVPPPPFEQPVERLLFVCTANSARSQLAAHLWHARTGLPALSAGTDPAARVHPAAVATARRHGLDLTGARPMHLLDLDDRPDLLVSVCDRAHEGAIDRPELQLHWSIPDPVGRGAAAFERTFSALARRIERLADVVI